MTFAAIRTAEPWSLQSVTGALLLVALISLWVFRHYRR